VRWFFRAIGLNDNGWELRIFPAFFFWAISKGHGPPTSSNFKEGRKWHDFKAKLSGLITARDMASSGKKAEPTFLFIIQQSKVTDSSHFKRAILSSLRLYRGKRGRKPTRLPNWHKSGISFLVIKSALCKIGFRAVWQGAGFLLTKFLLQF
jgi:hypothetical protein